MLRCGLRAPHETYLNMFDASIDVRARFRPSQSCVRVSFTCTMLRKLPWSILVVYRGICVCCVQTAFEERGRHPIAEALEPQWLTLYTTWFKHTHTHTQILRSARTLYLFVLCGSENKQRLFPYTTLTDWFL